MLKLYNLGDSFSYGNCAIEKNNFDVHKSPATFIADEFNLLEVNFASPGASIDTIVRRLLTYGFDDEGIFMIGLSHSNRFQYSSTRKVDQSKKRRNIGFTRGPKRPQDWFMTKKWDEMTLKEFDLPEQMMYHSFKNILIIQKLLKEKKYFMYNTISGLMKEEPKNWEVQKIKKQIDLKYYYEPNHSLYQSNLDDKYYVADDDVHSNHIGMKKWTDDLKEWIKNVKII